MPLSKRWSSYEPGHDRELPGNLGVYELGDEAGEVLYIGYAGGRSLLGLRGVLADHFSEREPNALIRERARSFRYEINQMYLTRWIDLLTRYRDAHGRLPPANLTGGPDIPTLGHFARS